MTHDEKLDLILAQLAELKEHITKPKARQNRPAARKATPQEDPAREAILRAVGRLHAGRYTAEAIACASGLPDGRGTSHTIGRVMDELGVGRYRTSAERGFVVTAAVIAKIQLSFATP